MIRMFCRHPILDYARWRLAYDASKPERLEMGVRGDASHQSLDDPNDVTVWHDFDTREAAERFIESPRLQALMEEAGVAGAPAIWFTRMD